MDDSRYKFRAWDKIFKIIIYALPNGYEIRLDGKINCLDSNNKITGLCRTLELMQYTGLKDKNGTEIYEGDVIKSGRTGLNYKIVWDDESASFIALCANPKKDYYIGPYSWADTEIIGNIFESPELLEK